MDLLFSEFINNNMILYNKYSVDSWHAVLWNLTKTLVKTFSLTNSLNHLLFKNNSQLNYKRCLKLYKYYNVKLE